MSSSTVAADLAVSQENAALKPHPMVQKPTSAFGGGGMVFSLSGLIGAGKTTLATALGKQLGLPVHFEPVVDNKYLDDFYSDMAKYSFPLQIYLLNNRFRQHQQIIWSGTGGISDRSIFEDRIFAKILMESGMMDERDYNTYISLFENISNFLRKPDVIVHLDVSPEESFARIQSRGRECESGISLEYLTALHAGYEEFLDDVSRYVPVIRVNWNEFQDDETMARMVVDEYTRMRSVHYVEFEDGKPVTPPSSPTKSAASSPSGSASETDPSASPETAAAARAAAAAIADEAN